MGELKHGVYDDCEGLLEEEIYAFYDFEDDVCCKMKALIHQMMNRLTRMIWELKMW